MEVMLRLIFELARKRTQGGEEEEVQGTGSISRAKVPFHFSPSYLLLSMSFLVSSVVAAVH